MRRSKIGGEQRYEEIRDMKRSGIGGEQRYSNKEPGMRGLGRALGRVRVARPPKGVQMRWAPCCRGHVVLMDGHL